MSAGHDNVCYFQWIIVSTPPCHTRHYGDMEMRQQLSTGALTTTVYTSTVRDAAGPVASALGFLISLRAKCC